MEEVATTLFDASAYVLFEATGDSEAEHFDGDSGSAEISADDDAQSCSHGSVAGGEGKEGDGSLRADACDRVWEVGEEAEYGGEGSDSEDGVVDQCRGGGRGSPAAVEMKKSKGREGSGKVLSEREGDRLFWEACLASHE